MFSVFFKGRLRISIAIVFRQMEFLETQLERALANFQNKRCERLAQPGPGGHVANDGYDHVAANAIGSDSISASQAWPTCWKPKMRSATPMTRD
jgi:hypothetical protein